MKNPCVLGMPGVSPAPVDQVWTRAFKSKVFEKHEIWTILMDKVKWSLETAKTDSCHGLPLLIGL
jgi:hypothetical protein